MGKFVKKIILLMCKSVSAMYVSAASMSTCKMCIYVENLTNKTV